MAHVAQDFEFLQKALHRLVDAGFLADRRRHLQHHDATNRGAFGEKQFRHRPLRNQFDATVGLEPCAREILRHLRAGRHAPTALCLGLLVGRAPDRIVELGVLDLRLADHLECAGGPRFTGIRRLVGGGQEDHRRETFARVEVAQPVETRASAPLVIQQHHAVALREEPRRQRPANPRVIADEIDVRPLAGNVVPQERAVARVVVDEQQTHRRD